MKWLKSTSQKTWTIQGKTIPACETPHNDYLVLNDSEYQTISNIPVIKSLIKSNAIIVLDHEPAELKNSVEALQGSNAELTARIKQLEAELSQRTDAGADLEAVKAQMTAEKDAALKELDDKASAIIAEKDARIAELEAQLAKKKNASKKSDEE